MYCTSMWKVDTEFILIYIIYISFGLHFYYWALSVMVQPKNPFPRTVEMASVAVVKWRQTPCNVTWHIHHVMCTFSVRPSGLFHRAISQSGSALDPWAYAEPDFLHRKAFTIGERMNCRTSDPQELLRCFQQATAGDLVNSTIGEVRTADCGLPQHSAWLTSTELY